MVASPLAELPVELWIPTVDVAAFVAPVGLTAEQHLDTPAFGESGWYQFGPKPGDPGYAVMLGHIDSLDGPDVFHQLHKLREGEDVHIRMSTGEVLTFRVDAVTRQPKNTLPESRMWQQSDVPRLALVTCAGKFDRDLRSYPDNLVVYATAAASPDVEPTLP